METEPIARYLYPPVMLAEVPWWLYSKMGGFGHRIGGLEAVPALAHAPAEVEL
jgi:hypothetical protein